MSEWKVLDQEYNPETGESIRGAELGMAAVLAPNSIHLENKEAHPEVPAVVWNSLEHFSSMPRFAKVLAWGPPEFAREQRIYMVVGFDSSNLIDRRKAYLLRIIAESEQIVAERENVEGELIRQFRHRTLARLRKMQAAITADIAAVEELQAFSDVVSILDYSGQLSVPNEYYSMIR